MAILEGIIKKKNCLILEYVYFVSVCGLILYKGYEKIFEMCICVWQSPIILRWCSELRTLLLCGWQDIQIQLLANRLDVAAQVEGKLKTVTYTICLLKKGYTTSIKRGKQKKKNPILFNEQFVFLKCSKWPGYTNKWKLHGIYDQRNCQENILGPSVQQNIKKYAFTSFSILAQ